MVLLFIFGMIAFHADPAVACTCAAYSSFKDRVASASTVITGRVILVHRESASPSQPVSYVDVEVTEIRKGRVAARVVRVWDEWWESSCGGVLSKIVEGRAVTFAAWQVEEGETHEVWDALRFLPHTGDLYLAGGCATVWEETRR